MEKNQFKGWMLLELFGHNKIAGRVTEIEMFGAGFAQIEIPTQVGEHGMEYTTQLFNGASIYCATPIRESDAISLSKSLRPRPFDKFDLHRESHVNLGKAIECPNCGEQINGHDILVDDFIP